MNAYKIKGTEIKIEAQLTLACRNKGSFETTAAVKCACILSQASNTFGS